jgi:hypothetical protein
MKTVYSMLVASGLILLVSCQKESASLTNEQKKMITDSTTQVVQTVLQDLSKNFKDSQSMVASLNLYFSSDDDVRHTANGLLFTSLKALTDSMQSKTREGFISTIEVFEEKADRFDVLVLSKDAAAITVPAHFKIKAKGLPEYNGQEVLSFVVQKRNGKWLVTQSHVSEYELWKAIAALTPPKTEKSKGD